MATVKVSKDKDNQQIIQIISRLFGGEFARFFTNNLTHEFSSIYDLTNLLYKATNLNGDISENDQEATKRIFYIIFYDSLMDYIFFKAFGIGNLIKKNIPLVKRGAVSTGVPQYDNLIKNIFLEIAYSKAFALSFKAQIDNALLDPFYADLVREEDFKKVISDILAKRGGKLEEGILDKLFNSNSKRLRTLMNNAVDCIPNGFFARKKIINQLKNGSIDDFLTSVTDYRRFVAKEYADPLNNVAMNIILSDFFVRWLDKVKNESPEVQQFFQIAVRGAFSNSTFVRKMHTLSYSFFRQYAEFIHRKKAKTSNIQKTTRQKFKF